MDDFICFSTSFEKYKVSLQLPDDVDLRAYEFRKEVFCDELGWSIPVCYKYDIDRHDDNVVHFTVSYENNIIAFLRLHPYNTDWMTNTLFRKIAPNNIDHEKTSASCEVSRLAISTRHRKDRINGTIPLVELLYSALYAFCKLNKIRYVYMTVSTTVFRALRLRGLPCHQLGDTHIMEDGLPTVAARLDWTLFDEECAIRNPSRTARFHSFLHIARNNAFISSRPSQLVSGL